MEKEVEASQEVLDTEALLNMMEDLEEAKHKLEASEKKFRKLFENSQDAILVLTNDGKVQDLNPAAKRFLGEVKDIKKLQLHDPKKLNAHLSKAKKTGLAEEEFRLNPKDKEIIARASFTRIGKEKIQLMLRDITEERKNQKKIQESEERFRLLTENSGDIIWQTDKRLNMTYVSPAVKEILGYDPKELIGTKLTDDLGPGSKEIAKKTIKAALQGKKTVILQVSMKHKNGKLVPVEVLGKPVRTKGKIEGLQGSARDITERKKAEEALKESEKRFRKALLDAPIPVMLHAEGEVVLISNIWTKITGYKLKEIPTIEKWTQKAYGMKKKKIKEVIFGLYKRKKPTHEGEFKVKTKKGEKRIWDFHTSPIGKLPDGRKLVMSTAVDVTKRSSYEKELKGIRNQLVTIIQANPTAQFFISKDHKIRYWNKAMEKLTGVPAKDAVGTDRQWHPFYKNKRKVLADFLIEEDYKGIKKSYGNTVKKSDTYQGAYTGTDHFKSIGDGKWLTFNAVAVKDEKGEIIGSVETIQDITKLKEEHKKLEEQEKNFRTLTESANVAILILQDKKFTYVNPKTCEWIKYSKEELLGKKFLDLIHPDDKKRVMGYHVKRLLGMKVPESYRFRAVTKNKETIHIDVKASRMEWNGKPAALTFMNNVTKQVQAEEAIKEAKQKYDLLIEQTGDLVYDYDIENNNLEWEGNIKKTTGHKKETFCRTIGQWKKLIHKEDRKKVTDILNEAIKKGGNFICEYRFKHKKGHYLHIYDRGFIMPGKKRMIGMMRDITKKERTRKKFENYVEASPHGIFIMDEKGNYKEVNKAATDITRYKEEELLKMNLLDISVDKNETKKSFKQLKKDGQASTELKYKTKDKEERWWQVDAVKAGDDYIRYVRDIDEEKKTRQIFEDYVNLSQVILVELDLKGKVVFMNQYAKDLLGDLTGKEWAEKAIPKGHRDNIRKIHKKNLKGKLEESHKNPVKTKKGEKMVLWRNKVLKEKGNIKGTLSSGTLLLD